MTGQKLLAFDDLEWSWEAWRPVPVGRWLPGDPRGFVWYATREEATAAALRPFWRGQPFYRRWRIVCRPAGGE